MIIICCCVVCVVHVTSRGGLFRSGVGLCPSGRAARSSTLLSPQVGDRVGLTVHEDGRLHFFVNGVDQGAAALGVPRAVYGVVDLYGQAAQVTIVERARSSAVPSPVASSGSSATLYR